MKLAAVGVDNRASAEEDPGDEDQPDRRLGQPHRRHASLLTSPREGPERVPADDPADGVRQHRDADDRLE